MKLPSVPTSRLFDIFCLVGLLLLAVCLWLVHPALCLCVTGGFLLTAGVAGAWGASKAGNQDRR